MVNILVVDDHVLAGEGIKTILEKEADLNVEFIHATYQQNDFVLNKKYDTYILDLHSLQNGIEMTKKIIIHHPEARILIFAGDEITTAFLFFVDIGVAGFINRTCSTDQFVRTIRSAIDDQAVVPLKLFELIRGTNHLSVLPDNLNYGVSLSLNEQEVLSALKDGLCNQDIADKLHLSKRTVEKYLTNIYRKLEVKNRTEALAKAIELHLISNNNSMIQ
ncbi:two-component system, NarL family, competent response regulator ComA [Evansella caseinilytica]|uniref:Two-component system, NarL family, competent response regulator ComA n=1 Tax=Evansella caseinilytica TaxID=1503961 RepID=A0A1H3UZY9_9BACI|nr:response regulator transcription factor [Evansella caseinilytica]SDZ68010.1 two-component system, NarL family, competent response regulator ComA [Evansella caseinilytica]